jgi:hypothetical protein
MGAPSQPGTPYEQAHQDPNGYRSDGSYPQALRLLSQNPVGDKKWESAQCY